MDGIIQVKVKGSYLSKDSDRGGVRGEANVTLMRIEFSEDWVEFEDKRITFLNALGRNPTEIKLTDELLEEGTDKAYLCFIPGEAYTHDGWFSFVIDGYAEGVRKRSVEGKLECVYAPSVDGEHLPADYELAEIKVMSGTRDVVHLPKKGVYFDKVIALGDEDLIPENIKAGVVILGVEGSFEGEKGLLSEIIVRSGPADFVEIPATGFYGIGKVTVEGDPDLVPQNIKAGVTILDVEGTYVPEELKLVAKSLTITQNGKYTVTPGNGYAGMSRVTVTADVPQTVEKIDAELQSKSIMPGTRDINVKPDEGYDALSQVTVYGDGDLVPENIKSGVTIFNVLGTYEKRDMQSKNVTPGKNDKTVSPDSGYDGLSYVKVYGDTDLIPQNIREGVNIFGVKGSYSTGQNFQDKTVTPSRSRIIVQPDEDYDALATVYVNGDSNLTSDNIADGVTIFGVLGSYVSPMKEITVVPSHDEQVIIPALGYYGFSKITVLSSDATGDYNEGYRDAQEEAAEQIAGLEEEISQLTQDKNAAYGEGYEEGYDDGYKEGAASGGGEPEELDTSPYMYGVPDENGKIALADGDGYVLYKGGLFPNYPWNKKKYPYVVVNASLLFDSFEFWPTKPEVRKTSKGTDALLPEIEPTKVVHFEQIWGASEWSGPYETELGMTYNIARVPKWSNTKLYRDTGELYIAGTAPIPLTSADPVAAVYNGVKLPPLPEYDKEAYPYSCIKMGINTYGERVFTYYACPNPINRQGDYYYAGGRLLTCQCRPDSEEDSARAWSDLKEGFALSVKSDELMWTSHDISYTEEYGGGLVRSADPAPIPVYEQKE